jgi:hypothetical protein
MRPLGLVEKGVGSNSTSRATFFRSASKTDFLLADFRLEVYGIGTVSCQICRKPWQSLGLDTFNKIKPRK